MASRTVFAQGVLFRVSVENGPGHAQAEAIRAFCDQLRVLAGDELDVRFRDSGGWYRDTDAIAALGSGDLEMAVPGIWHLDRHVPDIAALMLPSMYGRSPAEARTLVDSEFGKGLATQLEAALPVRVVGRWIELGHVGIFGAKRPILRIEDLVGKRIRLAGGRANEERLRALGALPVIIPWTDLPDYLDRGLVDGVLSSYDAVDSAGLLSRGLVSALEDREYYGFYIPMVSRKAWDSFSPRVRSAFLSAWESQVDLARLGAAKAQEAAKRRMVEGGLKVAQPSPSALADARFRLVSMEEAIAARLHVDPAVLRALRNALGSPR